MEFAAEGGEGADAVRGPAPRGDEGRQHQVQPPGRGRGDLAGDAAPARRAAAGPPLRPRAPGAPRRPTPSPPASAAGGPPGCRPDAGVSGRAARSRWSPTRRALAIAVRAGFTAPMLGKKLVSTT